MAPAPFRTETFDVTVDLSHVELKVVHGTYAHDTSQFLDVLFGAPWYYLHDTHSKTTKLPPQRPVPCGNSCVGPTHRIARRTVYSPSAIHCEAQPREYPAPFARRPIGHTDIRIVCLLTSHSWPTRIPATASPPPPFKLLYTRTPPQ